MLDNVSHDLGEGFERDAVPGWWWLRLETDLGDNEGLCEYSSKHLREGSEN